MPSYGLGRTETYFDFKVPSGNTCRMKHADLQALIAAGVIDSIDTLTSLVQTEHVDRVKKGTKNRHIKKAAPQPGAESAFAGMPAETQQMLTLMKDEKRWNALLKIVDAVVVQCVLAPRVIPDPPDSSTAGRPEAGDGEVYVDEVSMFDRLAIFAEAMGPFMAGSAAMEPFRPGREASVAGMADEPVVPDATKRNAGAN